MPAYHNQTIGDYTLVEPIGSGGMGAVYRARHSKIGREVAIKIMTGTYTSDSAFERFRNEARIHSSLSHPNIATLFEFYEKEGRAYIVMEFVDGQTLSDRIRNSGRMDVRDALPLFRKVLEAVSYIHQANIIHRDIKSNNIKITSKHDIKLLDFGIAKAPFSSKLTCDRSFIGTMEYLSPEQIQGKPATVRSDIWALGVLLYEMITGQLPFQSESLSDLCDKIIKEGYTSPSIVVPGIPQILTEIIERCLKKKAEHRYPSVQQIIHAVDGLLKKETVEKSAFNISPLIDGLISRIKNYWLICTFVFVISVSIVVLKVLLGNDEVIIRNDTSRSDTSSQQTDQGKTENALNSQVIIEILQGGPADITVRKDNGESVSCDNSSTCEFKAPVGSHFYYEIRRKGFNSVIQKNETVYELDRQNLHRENIYEE
jgi:serine/threonine protein kinase